MVILKSNCIINSLDKKYSTSQVASLFNSIARTYDFLNHFLSGGMDFYWRRKAIKFLGQPVPDKILDVACGTGDFSIVAAKYGCKSVIGIDIAENMLEIARNKIRKANFEDKIAFKIADAENLPFNDESFQASIVAFGIRNFNNLKKGLSEIYRVLTKNGKFIILEFSKPKHLLFRKLYFFYFQKILPLIGKIISKNKIAYTYLPNTVMQFPEGKELNNILEEIGFRDVYHKTLTFGIVTVYVGTK